MTNEKDIKLEDFFFCYDSVMAKWLRYEKGIEFLLRANHVKSNNTFWMFVQNEKLNKALEEFKIKSVNCD